MKIHRRHDLTDDPDWAGLHTLPVFYTGDTYENGEIRELGAASGSLLFKAEFRETTLDGAAVVDEPTPGTATFTIQAIQYLGRDGGVYAGGTIKTSTNAQRLLVEDELDTGEPVWVRITTVLNPPAGAGSLWIWASGDTA